jgi:carbonic anhydrase
MKFIFLLLTIYFFVLPAVHAATGAESLKPVSKPLLNLASEAKQINQKSKNNQQYESIPVKTKKNSKRTVKSNQPVNWGYSGKERPEFWSDLSEDFATCKTGKNQSPINLMDTEAVGTSGLDGFDVYYRDAKLKLKNNGHTVQMDYPLGSYITINNQRYELLQFHFHTLSEHQLNGFNYPLELQLVHKDAYGNLAIIAILFQEGESNPMLQNIVRKAPKKKTKSKLFSSIKLNPNRFFPAEKEFYKYSGSLTTPPCSQGVYWMVFKQPMQASASQIQRLHNIMGDNNRPVQKLFSRTVLKSWQDREASTGIYEFY